MFSAKLFSGDIVTLPAKTEEEFKRLYLETHIKPQFRPFVTLEVLQNEFLFVHVHPILPILEKEEYNSYEWRMLSENPAAIPFLRNHLDKVHWRQISANPGAIELIRENMDKVDWAFLSCNPEADDLLREYPESVNWYGVAELHPRAGDLLALAPLPYTEYLIHLSINEHAVPEWFAPYKEFLPSAVWGNLSSKPKMISFLEENFERVNFSNLCLNSAAAHLICKLSPSQINFHNLLLNTSPELAQMVSDGLFSKELEWSFRRDSDKPLLIHKLKQNLDLVNWDKISFNPAAADILETHSDMVTNWDGLFVHCNLVHKYVDRLTERSHFLYSYPCVICPDLKDF